MNVAADPDSRASQIAAAIGEPARGRMLYCLVDGLARTSTELAAVAGVTPSTASVHLQRLKTHGLVTVIAQGKHRYYTLGSADVAAALEALSVVAGASGDRFVPNPPHRLRAARTCYDHFAGTLGVALHDRIVAVGWLSGPGPDGAYDLTADGIRAFATLGIDIDDVCEQRRRLAFACVDWSERRFHLAGALGAALLALALRRRWVNRDLDSRALNVSPAGRREMHRRFGLIMPE
jgi:DNA-binding transcriptional ArsR family regulator